MGFRFRRSIRILPGLRLNIGKRGVSVSAGVRGAHVTVGHGQVRETVGLPGTGLSYTHVDGARHAAVKAPGVADETPVTEPLPRGRAWRGWLWIAVLVAIVAYGLAKSAPEAPVPDVYSMPATKPDRRGTEQQPIVVSRAPNELAAERDDQVEHSRNERWSTNATIVLSIFTILLWGANVWLIRDARKVSDRQAKDTRDAISQQMRSADAMHEVAEATRNNAVMMSGMFHKQMRAYLTVEIGTALYQDERLRFEAKPVLTNNGLTPARNVCFRVMADILEGANGPPTVPRIEDLIVNDMGLAPRQQVTLSRVVANRIPENEVADVLAGTTRRLHAWGRVTYDDVFDGSWETNFYFSYFFPKSEKGYSIGGNFSTSHNNAT
jgi:hypothetical protein